MTLFNTPLSRQGRFMQIVAPARGLLRQSQNRLPQADPPSFCRRSASLTPSQARRSFSASAYAAKQIVKSAIIALVIQVSMNGAMAQGQVQKSQLQTVQLPLKSNDPSNPLGFAWKDRLAAVAAMRAEISPPAPSKTDAVFFASFLTPTGKIILSALQDKTCQEFSGLSLPASVQSCDARVIYIEHGVITHVQHISDYRFALPISDDPTADNDSQTDFTVVSYDPQSRRLITSITADGKPQEQAPPISLKY